MTKSNLEFIGIGHDIVDIARIAESISRFGDRFFLKLFTQHEVNYCKKKQAVAMHFAGRFAAKEAIAKAIGTGFGEYLAWQDVEILNDELGKPIVHFSENFLKNFPDYFIDLSISHTETIASAVAIVFRR
jgi:holo-[acyl-carrier protein] synthase